MERPRTRFVEIAVPYLTAKAQTTVLDANHHALLLRNIYLSHDTPSSGDDRSRNTILPMQFIGSEYEAQLQHANFLPVPPVVQFVEDKHEAKQQTPTSQQPSRWDPGLQAPQNVTQSQQQRVNSQLVLPQAPHSQPHDNVTLVQQPQVTQYAPPPQASYLQLPGDGTLDHPMQLSNSPQPCMTHMEFLRTPASSISQQSLDTTQPQTQKYPIGTELGISSDSPQSNILSAENPSTVIGSMRQQNIGVSQPQHKEDPLPALLGYSQGSPPEDYTRDFIATFFDSNNNDPFPDMDSQEEDIGIDLMDMGNYYEDYNSASLDNTSNDPVPDMDNQEESNGTGLMDTWN
ncbi:hypothetical protein FCIRC_5401 [Fusarium circinatum]|uniref:Uncharacterized protein n=1 Tax=Fusarium circinatum TaxID=48490 RepID=A0A8H5X395_FUSCI|nr:hypothetical protein FCIRC_5401 [Fusarium circinatum]